MNNIDTFLRDLIRKAGKRLLKHYGRVKTIAHKAGAATNLVTNADQDVERYIKAEIRKRYPDDSILAEESPIENANASRRWIIDPLDGTTNFAHGLSLFSISIGIEVRGEIVSGCVFDPVHNELFFARKGRGATMNNRRIHVSKWKRMDQSLLVTGFPYDVHDHPERSLPYFNAVIQQAQGLRRLGSAALDLCYVASGRFDGFFEVHLNPWDTAAGSLILREAGGIITDFNGRPHSIYERDLVSSNGHIHEEFLKVLGAVKREQDSLRLVTVATELK